MKARKKHLAYIINVYKAQKNNGNNWAVTTKGETYYFRDWAAAQYFFEGFEGADEPIEINTLIVSTEIAFKLS